MKIFSFRFTFYSIIVTTQPWHFCFYNWPIGHQSIMSIKYIQIFQRKLRMRRQRMLRHSNETRRIRFNVYLNIRIFFFAKNNNDIKPETRALNVSRQSSNGLRYALINTDMFSYK